MKQLQQWSLVTLCSLALCAAAVAQTSALQPTKPQAQTTAPVEETKGKKKKSTKKSSKKDAETALPATGATGTAAAATPEPAVAEMPAGKAKGGGKKVKGGGNATNATGAIRAVLDAQTAAWNAGKLEEFMQGYWNSPELTFVSGGRKLMGYDATLDRYRRTYQADGKDMGKLTFGDLEIMPLGNGTAFVRGQYQLLMSDARELSGRFTLVLRQFADGWKVIHDHTSANQ